MAARAKPPELKLVQGTARKDRKTERVVKPVDGKLVMPKWLNAAAKKVWKRKVAVYEKRGQSVVGCEDALAQYCALEAKLIALWKAGETPMAALVTQHRIWAAEFYDTPASQVRRVPKGDGTPGQPQPDEEFRL